MPSSQKIIYFMACACSTSVSAALLAYAMSESWARTRLECSRGNDTFDGSAVITLDLFSGFYQRDKCPLVGSQSTFNVFKVLNGAALILSALVVLFLVVCLICSACSILIALYNSVSNPYQTYMGPIGVYVSSAISACLSAVVLIIYAVTVTVSNMVETIVLSEAGGSQVILRNKISEFHLGYFLVIPYTVLSLGAIAVVYLYDHAAYTQRMEQQRPTEDAPKEIMMY
uniref:Clarin 3 n=1 Tax=Neogobius melanostomus TaxID=47308 RepID=A0A8C6UGE1_9GOBI